MKVGRCSDIVAACASGSPVQASDTATNKHYRRLPHAPAFSVARPERSHFPSAILSLPAFVRRSPPDNSRMYPSSTSRFLCSVGIVRCTKPFAQARNEANSSRVNGGADKRCVILRICPYGGPFQASHFATIKHVISEAPAGLDLAAGCMTRAWMRRPTAPFGSGQNCAGVVLCEQSGGRKVLFAGECAREPNAAGLIKRGRRGCGVEPARGPINGLARAAFVSRCSRLRRGGARAGRILEARLVTRASGASPRQDAAAAKRNASPHRQLDQADHLSCSLR
jgi:hypothetical protein